MPKLIHRPSKLEVVMRGTNKPTINDAKKEKNKITHRRTNRRG